MLCLESGHHPPKKKHQETKSDTKAKSLFNYKVTQVLHSFNTVGRVGETLSHSGVGHLLGVDQGQYIWESASCIVTVSRLVYLRTGGSCLELIGQLQLWKGCNTWRPWGSGAVAMVTAFHLIS